MLLCNPAGNRKAKPGAADTALRLRAADKMDMDRMIKESLTKLVLHEIGHTLGLNHNFKASHLHDPVAIHNRDLTSKVGLYGSVMDYPTINIAPEGRVTICPVVRPARR